MSGFRPNPRPLDSALSHPSRSCLVAIIGAGPAGMSAALILGRCRRHVMLFDSNQPRNAAARAIHGFITREGTSPHELRRLGREELRAYPSVEFHEQTVHEASRGADGFDLTLSNGERISAHVLLFATGRKDLIPDKPGFAKFMGRGVYHCPLCDGWEHRDQLLCLYSPPPVAVDLAVELLTWSRHVTICSDGPCNLETATRERLGHYGIALIEATVTSLEGDGVLAFVRFADAPDFKCSALFFCGDCLQKSPLPAALGCALDEEGSVICDGHAARHVPRVYVAGNVRDGLHLAIVAAAEGAEAGAAINDALLEEEIFPPSQP